MDAMWFYDEEDDIEELQAFRQESHAIEEEHLRIRVALRDAESSLRAQPGDKTLEARVEELKKRLEELDKQAPRISSAVPMEILLWGVPHG